LKEHGARRVEYRLGLPADALCLGILSTQVFLDTYATAGIRTDLANEAVNTHSPAAFERILSNQGSRLILAEVAGYLVGFAELAIGKVCPAAGGGETELVRLYVQQNFQRSGIGRELCNRAEEQAKQHKTSALWLTAWCGNARALAFYPAIGYKDIGRAMYVIEGQGYENHVFSRQLSRVVA
jgi:ribosomal protein S18 acetylase RimI-like enzyme